MEFTYTVPNGRNHAPLQLYAVQGEAGARTFTLRLTGGGAVGGNAYVYVLKNDGNLVVINAGRASGSVTFTLPLQACTCPGKNKVYIQVIDGQTETRWDNIELWVQPCDLEDAVASTDDLGPLADIITDPDYLEEIQNAFITAKDNLDDLMAQFSPKGEYDPEVAYAPYNIVAYEGMSYIAKKPSTGVLPTDTEHWALLVSNAVPGPQGPQGKLGKGPARIVVGTSLAGWTASDCDLLCDGESDQQEINAAIQQVLEESSTGGQVLLLDGTYNISERITISPGKKTLILSGSGPNCTRIVSTVPKQNQGDYNKGSQAQKAECESSCAILVSLDASFSIPDFAPTVQNLSLTTEVTSCGIAFTQWNTYSGGQVRDCSFEGFNNGVFTENHRCQIEQCYFSCPLVGVQLYGGATYEKILHCNFSKCGCGVHASGLSGHSLVQGCNFDNCGLSVYFRGNNSQIVDNNFYLADGELGINLNEPNRDIVSRNVFEGGSSPSGNTAIQLKDVVGTVISENVIDSVATGILVKSGTRGGSTNNTVTGNTCYRCTSGITVSNDGNGLENNSGQNIISGNTVRGASSRGIYIEADDNIVSSNQIADSPSVNGVELSANYCICTSNLLKSSGTVQDLGIGNRKANNFAL